MATATTQVSTGFSDLDLNFTIHPIKKDINRHKNETAVVNSIKNLILTNHYEKPFQPDIGSNVRRLLFENIDTIIAAQLERAVVETIENFEPRAQVNQINAIADPDNNGYKLRLEFFVINSVDPITINFFLERIR